MKKRKLICYGSSILGKLDKPQNNHKIVKNGDEESFGTVPDPMVFIRA